MHTVRFALPLGYGTLGGGRWRLASGCRRATAGRVNLKVNRTSRRNRQVYPDRDSKDDHALYVYWLEVGGTTPAEEEYRQLPNIPQVLGALTMIDSMLSQKRPVPKTFMESFTEAGVKLWEIKAPQRGKNISRLLAYRERDWSMFVALARAKKSQELPSAWKRTACDRVKGALREGGPL
jgi:hypothetical protein